MKKCKGCNKEIDKYSIACEYCGRLQEERRKARKDDSVRPDSLTDRIRDK